MTVYETITFDNKTLDHVRGLKVGKLLRLEGFPPAIVSEGVARGANNMCRDCLMRWYTVTDGLQCPLLTACVAHRRKDKTSVWFQPLEEEGGEP